MKTPIPEKIRIIEGSGSGAPIDQNFILLKDRFNSLIYVLTEHENHMTKQFDENRAIYERMNKMQKEIEGLKGEIKLIHMTLENHQSHNADRMDEIEIKIDQPYTAMRSTGELKWCDCKESIQCNSTGCINVIYQHCAKCEKQYKPIKEDVREKLAEFLYRNFNHTQQKWEDLYEVSKTSWFIKSERILAIVKGE